MANTNEENVVNIIIGHIVSGRIKAAFDEIKNNTKSLLHRNRALTLKTADFLMKFLTYFVKGQLVDAEALLELEKTYSKKRLTNAQINSLLQLVSKPVVIISNISGKRRFTPDETIKLRVTVAGIDVRSIGRAYSWNFFPGLYNESSTLIAATPQKKPQGNIFNEEIRFPFNRLGQFSIKFELIYEKSDGTFGSIPSLNSLVIEIIQPTRQPEKPKASTARILGRGLADFGKEIVGREKSKESSLEEFIDAFDSILNPIMQALVVAKDAFQKKKDFLTNEQRLGFLDKLRAIGIAEKAFWWEKLKELREEGNPLKEVRDLDTEFIKQLAIIKRFEIQLLNRLEELSRILSNRNIRIPEVAQLQDLIKRRDNDLFYTAILHLIEICIDIDKAEEIREEQLIEEVEEGDIGQIVRSKFEAIKNDERKLEAYLAKEQEILDDLSSFYIKGRQHDLISRIKLKIKATRRERRFTTINLAPEVETEKPSRRNFVKGALIAGGALAAGVAGVGSYDYLTKPPDPKTYSAIIIRIEKKPKEKEFNVMFRVDYMGEKSILFIVEFWLQKFKGVWKKAILPPSRYTITVYPNSPIWEVIETKNLPAGRYQFLIRTKPHDYARSEWKQSEAHIITLD